MDDLKEKSHKMVNKTCRKSVLTLTVACKLQGVKELS